MHVRAMTLSLGYHRGEMFLSQLNQMLLQLFPYTRKFRPDGIGPASDFS